MALVLSKADEAFRDEVRAFLKAELTPELRREGRRCAGIYSEYPVGVQWHRILARKGWSVPKWPVEYGGTGWTPVQQYIFAAELFEAEAPPLAPNGPRMVAPVIMEFGTQEQKDKYLPAIRNGDDYWAQGYSEPGSGSDLAALQCKAVRDGDEYVINGTKIWTTHAHWANRIFCLVRTANTGKPQTGISFLLFDMDLPGITVQPIISLAGDHELNQVFFDDVRVPVSSLLGKENDGWTVAKFLLQHERGTAWTPQLRTRLRRLKNAAAQFFGDTAEGSAARSDFMRKLTAAECEIDALQALELRTLYQQQDGKNPGIAPSMSKVLGSELRQKLTELAVEVGGYYALARPSLASLADEGDVPEEAIFGMSTYMNDRAASIYAGSNEIQRNIIAARLLAG